MKASLSRRSFLRWSGLAAATTLAACVQAPLPQQGASVEAGAPSVEKLQVEFMNWWGAQREELMNQSVARFNEEHPEIEVINSVQPWDRRAERAATAIASSTPPGLIMTRREETYKFAQEGLIIPISDYVEAGGLDVDALFYVADINNQRWGGELWSLPLPGDGGATTLYFYNKELLASAGFDPENPPQTWQELEAVAQATTVIDAGIQVLGVNVGSGYDFPSWLYCNNGKYCTDDAMQLTFNSAEGVETLEWMAHIAQEINQGYDNVLDFNTSNTDESADFKFYNAGQVIHFTGTWGFGHLQTWAPEMWADTDQWGVALRPYNGDNPDAASQGVSGLQWAWGYTIPQSLAKANQDAAYTFVEWWITQGDPTVPGGCQFLFEQSQISAAIECSENPAWNEINPYWDTVIEALGVDISVPITPVQSQITALLSEAVERAVFGEESAQEALDWAAEQGQAVLDEFWSNA
jgi:ABC-type glycerol-3-phosphate transport system substrate-binding protein